MSDPMAWITERDRTYHAELASADDEPVPTSVYRLYDADGALLYVGITAHRYRRLNQHAESKAWWNEVATATFSHYPTPREALFAEATAIQDENPLHNVQRPRPSNHVKHKVTPSPFLKSLNPPSGEQLRGTLLTQVELLEIIDRYTKRLYKMRVQDFIEAWQSDRIDRSDNERLGQFAHLLGQVRLPLGAHDG